MANDHGAMESPDETIAPNEQRDPTAAAPPAGPRVGSSGEQHSASERPNRGIAGFAYRAEKTLGSATTARRFTDTKANRVLRRFSSTQVAEFLGFERNHMRTLLEHPDAPRGEGAGRERLFSVHDIMKIRALASTRPRARRPILYWRKAGDRLPVITISSLKGGTAKSSLSAHLAQFANLFYGLRVGVIDADPQATCSLYFANTEIEIAGPEVETFTTFMGLPQPGDPEVEQTPEQMNALWKRTPWPGLRLLPGGAEIHAADIALHIIGLDKESPRRRRIHRLLRDALHRWGASHPPRTAPEEFFDGAGRFRDDVYEDALYETLDLVIIDTAPTLSTAQLNAVLAADTLIIPQTMRGFDLSTLRIYLAGLADYLQSAEKNGAPIEFTPLPSYIVPTIVSKASDTDQISIGELYAHDPETVCPIYVKRSEAVANAAQNYQSVYEYQPPKSQRESTNQFLSNINAVGEAILTRAMPGLPARGFANRFVRDVLNKDIEDKSKWPFPLWTEEDDR
jgi:chromosome partitioning protein